MIRRRIQILAAVAAMALLGLSGTAKAEFTGFIDSFDGSGSPTGPFVHPFGVALNFQDDSILVLDAGKGEGATKQPVYQFDLEGNPKPFAATGTNSLGTFEVKGPEVGAHPGIAVDNSGTASQGNIYVVSSSPPRLYGFDKNGNPLGGGFPVNLGAGSGYCGITVSKDGGVWISPGGLVTKEYKADGTPGGVHYQGGCFMGWNSAETRYYGMFGPGGSGHGNGTIRFTGPGPEEWGDMVAARKWGGLSLDWTNDDVYIDNEQEIVHLGHEHEELGRFGKQELFAPFFNGLVASKGIAVDPDTKSVYVGDPAASPPSVVVFGRRPAVAPTVEEGRLVQIRSTSALLDTDFKPNGGDTEVLVEYGTDTGYGSVAPNPEGEVDGPPGAVRQARIPVPGLEPGEEYHFRLVAINETDRVEGPDQTLITYEPSPGEDPCENALVRKQTGAAALADCRAYELASAPDTAGYDVRSDLVPGQLPLPGRPLASNPSKLLYTLETGSIPGTGVPTTFLNDPYVATRDESGWKTSYVGIPANGTPSTQPFASSLTASGAILNSFAFAGDDLCTPCFADGSTGIPVRGPDGSLEQGMAGSESPVGAKADILVHKRLSDDGTHLVFASTSKFEPDATAGQPTVYVRNLVTDHTEVVSKDAGGGNITCPSDCATKGVAGLDINFDGSHVVVGRYAGTNAAGANLWHPFVNIDGASSSIDLTPGAAQGVLYNGMTADGSKVFFTTAEGLVAGDTDGMVDAYRADVGAGGATLTWLSTGPGGGNSTSCDPVADAVRERWNNVTGAATCDVVVAAGGGGIGSEDGSFYLLSPERLTGASEGVAEAPNLYLSDPDGSLTFVATLDSELNTPQEPQLTRNFVKTLSGFEKVGKIAADPDGDIFYVIDYAKDIVYRLDAQGDPAPFEVPQGPNGNELTGIQMDETSGIAVDDSGTGTDGFIYVAETLGNAVLRAFYPNGEVTQSGFVPGYGPSGVATSPSGKIMMTTYFEPQLITMTSAEPEDAKYEGAPRVYGGIGGVAYDDFLFYWHYLSTGDIRQYPFSEFDEGYSPRINRRVTRGDATYVVREAGSRDYLINRGTEVDQYNFENRATVPDIGKGLLGQSDGMAAIAGGPAFVNDRSDNTVKVFGDPVAVPDPQVTATPIALHGLTDPYTRHPEDLQVEPSGGSAAFVSTMPLSIDFVGQKRQVFRYDAGSGEIGCASCNLTRLEPTDGARLSPHGGSIATGGRVFFTTAEPLALRDANDRLDVYQWDAEEGVQLISPGNSQFDNSLLSASWDGVDVFFFTRDTLVSGDRNGQLMKIYDAREKGGIFVLPARVPCAASDECHGPGTEPPAKLKIGTVGDLQGKGGNVTPAKKCGKGKVLKKNRCVPRKKKKKKSQRSKRGARHGGKGR